jgi:hypothetical protein
MTLLLSMNHLWFDFGIQISNQYLDLDIFQRFPDLTVSLLVKWSKFLRNKQMKIFERRVWRDVDSVQPQFCQQFLVLQEIRQ